MCNRTLGDMKIKCSLGNTICWSVTPGVTSARFVTLELDNNDSSGTVRFYQFQDAQSETLVQQIPVVCNSALTDEVNQNWNVAAAHIINML